MRKILLSIILGSIVALFGTLSARAQMAAVRGKAVDANGKPIAGAIVELVNTSNRRKFTFKTNGKGEFFSIGLAAGTYDATLTKDGQVIDSVKNFSAEREENVLDFNLAKANAKREKALKENEKIQGLNTMLKAAWTASQTGNDDEAIRLLTQATQLDASHDVIWAQLGSAYLNAAMHTQDQPTAAKDYQLGAAALQMAIEIKPTAAYYNNLGAAYAKLGRPQEAIRQYQLAAQSNPTGAAMYNFNLGVVLTNSGRIDEANAAFDKVITANPNYADAYYEKAANLIGKATVDQKTGATITLPEAAVDLNKYLELAPNGPYADSAKALLASLGAKVESGSGKTKAGSNPKN